MAASTDGIFWGFCWYVTHNPFKDFGGMTEDDFHAMAYMYAAENSTEIDSNLSRTTGGGYSYPSATMTSVEYPGTITAALTKAATDQSDYPERVKY